MNVYFAKCAQCSKETQIRGEVRPEYFFGFRYYCAACERVRDCELVAREATQAMSKAGGAYNVKVITSYGLELLKKGDTIYCPYCLKTVLTRWSYPLVSCPSCMRPVRFRMLHGFTIAGYTELNERLRRDDLKTIAKIAASRFDSYIVVMDKTEYDELEGRMYAHNWKV